MILYEVRNVSHHYNLDHHSVQALCGVHLEIRKGEFVSIAGPSGSGKTTLLNLLGLLESAREGTICFDGTDVSHLRERERTLLRGERIGFIFQTFNLIPVLSAYENVEYSLLKRKLSSAEVRQRVFQALEAVDIADQANQRPNRMSNGQRQRVAIARALARDVDVVLADEPTAALDQATGLAVIDLMKRLNRERGVTFLFSSHDPVILAAADNVIHLKDGRVME